MNASGREFAPLIRVSPADENCSGAKRKANSAEVDLVSVSPAHAVHGAAMRGKINAKLRSKAPDLDLPLLLRQLGTEVRDLCQKGCSRQSRNGLNRGALPL